MFGLLIPWRRAVVAAILLAGLATSADAQQGQAPLREPRPPAVTGLRGAPQPTARDVAALGAGAAWDAKPPAGVQPLPRDLFTTKDFYKDKDLWTDQRYWRCNSPRQIADMRSGGPGQSTDDPRIGANPPASARWGDCKADYARENIVSPYAFKTAKEHYAALVADARRRGAPTKYTFETMPRWDGTYGGAAGGWTLVRANQVPSILALLTPTYQQRMVQQVFHEGVDAAHAWSAAYCWPDGFMRQWATGGLRFSRILMNPDVVLFIGSGMNRVVYLNREFPLGPAGDTVRQWYGDTVGFWDGDALITWTTNVQGWNQHSSWEFSDSLESIEIFTPARDASGKFIGVDHEAVLYDPVALRQPVRSLGYRNFQQSWGDANRLGFELCTRPVYPIKGIPTSVAPGQVIDYEVPDLTDRPWADIWEKHLEKEMSRPVEELDLGFK